MPTRSWLLAVPLLATALLQGCATTDPLAASSPKGLMTARVNGVELHYLDRGKGEPIVFLHGGLMDYREWDPVAERLASEFRTITYSRRYNFPNHNAPNAADHSAVVDASDLAALNRQLRLGPMHVVGLSYGAYGALELALLHPEMVRTLTVVEPPLIGWLADLPGGPALFDAFYVKTWQPAGKAFERGDSTAALRITLDYFEGPGAIDKIPPEMRQAIDANIGEWRALTTSREAFPAISRESIRSLDMPVLMISGGKTYPMLRLTDDELERQLRNGRRTIVPEGTHDVCSEQPAVCAELIHAFIKRK